MHQAEPPNLSTPPQSRAARPPRMALAALIVSNICLPFGPVFVRMAGEEGLGPVAAAFWRITLAVPFLLVMLKLSGERLPKLGRRPIILLVIAGLFFAVDLGSWHLGIPKTKLANATLFGNSTVLFLPIYGFLVARAWPNRNEAAALLLAGLGAMVLMGRSYDASIDNLVGDLLCLTAGLLYTGYLVAMTRVRETTPLWSALVLSTIAGILPLLAIALALGEAVWPREWGSLLALALICQVAGQGLVTYALVHFQPIVIGLALLIQPIVAGTIGWAFYDERLGALDLLGAIAVAVALVLVRRPVRTAA